MENASKALIIAGGVLIGVMILTVFVYVFRSAAGTNKSYDERQAQKQLEAYNEQFEVYNKNNNTIMDLLTVINLAYDVNVSSEYDKQNCVEISIKFTDGKYFKLINNKEIGKNKILKTSSNNVTSVNPLMIISIYDLVNKNFSELGITSTGTRKNDLLIDSTLINEKTEYKYTFKCNKVDYHIENGKIAFMEFLINCVI